MQGVILDTGSSAVRKTVSIPDFMELSRLVPK